MAYVENEQKWHNIDSGTVASVDCIQRISKSKKNGVYSVCRLLFPIGLSISRKIYKYFFWFFARSRLGFIIVERHAIFCLALIRIVKHETLYDYSRTSNYRFYITIFFI
jgi:hypothetical protein